MDKLVDKKLENELRLQKKELDYKLAQDRKS